MATNTKSKTITVKVYSPQLGEKEVTTTATTWAGLQEDLSEQGVSVSGMKSVIGESQLTLESNDATIPTEDFTLFLMQKKTKSGGKYDDMSYKELRAAIQQAIVDDEDKAKAHFNKGKNYTTKKTNELRKLLKSYKGKKSSPKATATETATAKPQKATKAEKNNKKSKNKELKKLKKALSLLEDIDVTDIDEDVHDEIKDWTSNLQSNYEDLLSQTTSTDSPLASQYANMKDNF